MSAARPAYAAYVICATPRSGSTLLCDILSATGVAGTPNSYFHDIEWWAAIWGVEVPVRPHPYLAAMKQIGTGGSGIFGLRLMWGSVGEAADMIEAASGVDQDLVAHFEAVFGPTLFIHLSRTDKLAQAVSLVRAEQTGLWHVGADGSERERLAPAAPAQFDAAQILEARDKLASDDRQWSDFFATREIEPLHLTYEALAADADTVLATVLTALGCSMTAAREAAIGTARLADAFSAEWIDRLQGDAYAVAITKEPPPRCAA